MDQVGGGAHDGQGSICSQINSNQERDRAMEFPSISVVIPAHNCEATIRRALASVAAQTLQPAQIVIVDDASEDGTAAVASEIAGHKGKVIRLKENIGASGARNAGIRVADSDLIAFLDADDEWLPAKLEKQVKLLLSEPQSSFASCRTDLISADGVNLGDTFGRHRIEVGEYAWKALLASNFVTTPSVVVWRRCLEELGGFDTSLKIAEDQDMWIRLAERGGLSYVFERLVYEYEHENRLSGQAEGHDPLRFTLPMIERHIARLSNRLTPREIKSIRSRRYSQIGQLAFSRGAKTDGRQLVWRATKMGHRPLQGIKFLASTSNISIWLKNLVKDGKPAI
jgi:glycosyltransferase involved in cell wall biosynthesis